LEPTTKTVDALMRQLPSGVDIEIKLQYWPQINAEERGNILGLGT